MALKDFLGLFDVMANRSLFGEFRAKGMVRVPRTKVERKARFKAWGHGLSYHFLAP